MSAQELSGNLTEAAALLNNILASAETIRTLSNATGQQSQVASGADTVESRLVSLFPSRSRSSRSNQPQPAAGPVRTSVPRYEAQQSFGTWTCTRRRRAPAQQQHDHFNKDVILRPNPSWGIVCKQGTKVWLHKHGHILSAFEFQKFWDHQTVIQRIRDGFGEHIPEDVSLQLLMACGNKLVCPKLQKGQELNGILIHKVYKTKALYVKPSRMLLEDNEDYNQHGDSQDNNQLSSNATHSTSKMKTRASICISSDDEDCSGTGPSGERRNPKPGTSGPDGGCPAGSDGTPGPRCPESGPHGTSSTRGTSVPDGGCPAGSDGTPGPRCPESGPHGTSSTRGTSGPDGGCPAGSDGTPGLRCPESGPPGSSSTRGISGPEEVFLARHDGTSSLDEDNYSTYLTLVGTIPDDSSEDEGLQQAIVASMKSRIVENVPVQTILLELASKINVNRLCRFNINRAAVWEGAIRGFKRSSYEPNLMMSVKFSDDMGKIEEGVDLGGPRREFLRLLMESIAKSTMFEGKETSKNIALNSTALREDWYYIAGRAIAISLVHGGPPPNFLSPVVFSLLVDDSPNPVLEDIADLDLLEKVIKVSESTTIEDLEKAKASLLDYLANAGCLRPLRSIRDRDLLVQDIVMFQVIHRVQGPFQRFREGLKTLGVLEKIQKHPDSFRPLFCFEPSTLTADQVDDLFNIRLSPEGSNKRVAEEVVITYWRDYLQDAEEEGPSNLQKVLAFATGASVVPPIGFSPSPSVEFIHQGDDDFSSTPMFPKANTCINCIRLPLHVSFQVFKEKFDFALGNTYGFGRP
ncbi:uncharacterized protein LOC131981267 isoform X1 [Centropristis striata]|uniref:uncharacterized protein LOC131981267 isoform X1 n=1 Tax=Centropristis striata TaxID=184440 RepID=UPI0027E1C060|nr:uncharacterized protein LOC131981267 isoform X1 [Centropristis striata]